MSSKPLRWVLKRNCSASPGQLAWVLASIVAVSFVFGAGFALVGLWMVLPFIGLELLAVALAFFCYGRHAADMETLELRDGMLHVTQVDGARTHQRALPAQWVRVDHREQGAAWGVRAQVWLRAGAEQIEVGRHLRHASRGALARELRQALRASA